MLLNALSIVDSKAVAAQITISKLTNVTDPE
jgi:hypothetical protein